MNFRILSIFLAAQALAVAYAGPAADQASFKIIRGAKIAMKDQPARFDASCASAIPDNLLSQFIQPLLVADLEPAELAELDRFYSTPLAISFDDDLAAQKAEVAGYKPVHFTSAEQMTIGRALGSPAADKYFSTVSKNNPVLLRHAADQLQPYLERCAHAP